MKTPFKPGRLGANIFDLFDSVEPGRLLDLPAGAGDESIHLAAMGHRVVSLDLFTPGIVAERRLLWVRADCNYPLPIRDASFDYVLSREGIEHFENQFGFIRECARVLRPGGRIVITTPNVMHIAARLSHFLTGQRTMRSGLANEVQTLRGAGAGRYYHGHIFLVDYFRMRYMMRLAGLGRIEVMSDRASPSSLAMAWVAPLMYLASRRTANSFARRAKKRKRAVPSAELTREIQRHVFSPAMLFGKRMIVTAVREGWRAE